MNNSKKTVHSSGALGMLVKTGQIKKIDSNQDVEQGGLQYAGLDRLKATASSYYSTEAGIVFKENELVLLDPKECEPWEYANRSEAEMGDIDELILSIQENGQLQPALVMTHPHPHDGIKYQIIFGRRRHAACLKMGSQFLVVKKDALSIQEAISCQDAENKFRKNVSNYSNALLYKKLLTNKAYKSEKELAEKLGLSASSLSELMTYVKIPKEIIQRIPNIHEVSSYMAVKIVRLIREEPDLVGKIIEIAPEIGRSITTPAKLEKEVRRTKSDAVEVPERIQITKSLNGKPLFTFKVDHKGSPSIVFPKDLLDAVDFESLCENLQEYMASMAKKFGRPNLVTE